jgi:hypothetical protein
VQCLAALLAASLALPARADAPATLVVCAPGSPGTTQEAQGAMDALAKAVAARAALPPGALAAVYLPAEGAGLARLREKDAALALVSLPFFLAHEKALGLRAELAPVPQGGAATERWSLVARKGAVPSAASLQGYTILSTAGYAPAFVRGVLRGLGEPAADVTIQPSAAMLSGLRRAAAGEKVAVLLDRAQASALASLPFAADLEVVTRSPEVPAGILAVVGGRLPAARWAKLSPAFLGLGADPAGAEALAGIRMSHFAPLDAPALQAARKLHAEGGR